MKFDLLGAKRAGYSDAEIAEYAGPQFGFDVSSARNAGYSNTEIVRALALKSFESDPPSRKSFLDVSRLFSPQASDADLSDQWRRFYQPQGAIDDIDGRGTIAETGIGLIRGAMGRLPEQIGKALKWMGDAPQGDAVRGSTLHEIGQSLENVGSDYAQGEALRARPGSQLARAFGTGAEMVAPSLAPLVTATIGSVAGPAGTAAGFVAGTVGLGMSQAQDTYERAKAANLSDADASAAAWKTGAIEALGETAGGLALGWAFGMLGRVAGKAAGVSPVQAVFEAYRNPQVFKEFAKRLPGVYAAEISTEMGQSAGQAAVERAAGIPGQDPGEAAIDVIAPTAAMTTLLAPLGIAGQHRAARAQTFVGGAASDPEADPRLRTAAVQQIGEALRAADPAFASAWSTYAREQIAAKQPVELGEAIPRNGTDRAVGWILDSGTAEDAIAAAAKGVEQAGTERDPMAIDFSSTDADLARIEGHYESQQEAERLARQRAEIPGVDFERGIIGQQMRDAEFDAAVRQRDEAVAAAQARAKMAADRVRDRDEEMAAAARAERDAKIGSILRERQDEDAAQDIARRLQEHDARGLTTPLAQAYRAGLVRRLEQLGFEAPGKPAEVAAANEPVRTPTTPEVVAGLPAPAQRLEPEVSVSDIHRAAEARGIRWDDDPAFMAFTKGVTGKERLDELDAGERATMLAAVERRQAQAPTVDAGAHEAAASPLNGKTASREQILGGNAELGHPRVGGMDLSIENPAGSERRDLQNDPPRWRRTMRGVHYGYIKGTVGADKDHLDVFVREGTPEDWSGTVFVVNQNHQDGRFDEHKAVVGVTSEAEARRAYLDQYDAGQEKNIRSIVAMPIEEFKAWAYDKSKAGPRGGELKAKALPAVAPQPGGLFVEYGGRRYPVASLEDAGERWSEFREASGAGASQIGGGARIVDAGGKEVARISYNGKVWPPGEWQPGQRPLVGKTFEEERADADAIEGSAQVVEEKPAAKKQPAKLSGIKVFGRPVEKLTAKELKIAAKKAATEKQRDAARDEILRRASIEPTEKQKKARAEAKERFKAMAAERKRVDVDRDSIVPAIIKMGGVKMAERADITGDTKGKNPGIPGVGFLFTSDGLGVDDIAMRLGELDYLSRAELEDVDGGVAAVKEKIDDELSGRRTHWSLRSDTGFREAAERQADIDQQRAEAEQQAAGEVGQDLDLAVMPEELAAEGLPDEATSVARDELAARAEAIEEGVLERLAMQHDTDDAYWRAVAQFLEEREHAPVRDDAQDHRARQAEGEGSGVPADDGAPAPAAAEAESGEGGREKVDGDVPPGGRFPSGAPREHAEYLKESEYEKSLRSTYSTGKQPVSSRTTPQTAEIPAVGTWMIDDQHEGQDGREIYELRELDVNDLEISEDTGPEKWADVKRYAQWLLDGKEAPPIRVLQHESGTLKVSDHRRLMAAKAAGHDTIKAWVSWSTRSRRYGEPIVGMTYELAEQGNKRLPIAPAREDRKIFADDARALERIKKELAEDARPALDGGAEADAAEVAQPSFDSEAFDKRRADTIKASREAGNVHLDKVPAYVETMRGKSIFYVHDPKVRGTIRTVDNRGNVYVNWDDAYSAEKEMASEVQDGKRKVMQSSIGTGDLKDYALAPRREQTNDTEKPQRAALPARDAIGEGDRVAFTQEIGPGEKIPAEGLQRLRAAVADQPRDGIAVGEFRRTPLYKDGKTEIVFEGAVSNGDGTATLVGPWFENPPTDQQILEQANNRRSRDEQASEKRDAAVRERLARIKELGLEEGGTWSGAEAYVEGRGKSGRKKFLRATITKIEENGIIHVRAILPGSRAPYEFKTGPDSRLFDNYPKRPALDLQQQTEADLKARADAQAAAEKARADEVAAAEAKAAADRDRANFTLTGSGRAADANPGQGDMFGAVQRPAEPANTGGGLFAQPANPMVAVADALAQAADAIKAAVQPQGNQPSGRQAQQRATLEAIADRLGVRVSKTAGGWHAYGNLVEIPDEDVDAVASGAVSANHVFAHELGHVSIQKRGVSFTGFPRSAVENYISNWGELIEASREFRPGVHSHENERIRRHARKPNEIVADAIAAVMIGDRPIEMLRPMMSALGMTERDLGLAEAAQNPEQRNANPEAESQAPASSGDGDGGVAPTRSGVAPEASEDEKPADAPVMFSRRRIEGDALTKAFSDLAQNDEAFRFATSEARDLEGVLRDVDPEASITDAIESIDTESPDSEFGRVTAAYRIESPEFPNLDRPDRPRFAMVYEDAKKREVWVDLSQLNSGEEGMRLYQAVATYAHNRDWTFIGDPAGLSLKALYRRTEAMLSSALRHGTTRHLKPHERQVRPTNTIGQDIRPLDWRVGEDAHNLRELLLTAYHNAKQAVPEIDNYDFDERSGSFVRQGNRLRERDGDLARGERGQDDGRGTPARDGGVGPQRLVAGEGRGKTGLERLAESLRERFGLEHPTARGAYTPPLGVSALKRAILVQSVLRREGRGVLGDEAALRLDLLRPALREILYSRQGGETTGLGVDAVRQAIAPVRRAWGNAPPVEVVESIDDPRVPEAIRRENARQLSRGATGSPEGVFYGGKVYLFADQLKSGQAALRVLFHESLGHYGLRGVFGERLGAVLDDVIRSLPGKVREKAAEYGLDYGNVEARRQAAEEVLAELAQTQPRAGIVRRAVAAIKQFLREIGFDIDLTDADIIARYIVPARGFVERGREVGGDEKLAGAFSRSVRDRTTIDTDEQSLKPPTTPDQLNLSDVVQAARDSGRTLLTEAHVVNAMGPAFSRTVGASPATGNRGGAQTAGTPPAAPGNRASFDAGEPSKMDAVIRVLQDKHVDTRRVMTAIRNAGGALRDATDVYLQEELFHGRAAKGVADFLDSELRPLLADMTMRRVSMPELEEYLHARHAEEANEHVAAINPNLPDGGSGMMTADAQAYLDGIDTARRRALEALAARVDAIQAKTRQELVAYGLESQATITGWQQMFDHYVPLHREDMENGMGIGQGFSVRGPAAKTRTGSTRTVVDILANIALQRERAVVRGEKNRVALALVGLAEQNPNPDFWRVDRPPMIQRIDERTGLVRNYVDPLYKSRDNVVVARMPDASGEVVERAVVFNEHDERARRMAAALKNLDAEDLGEVLGLAAKATRYFASINTQYNPIFGVVNMIRDAQGALFNLSTTPIHGKQAEVLRHTIDALRGIYIDAREARAGRQPNSVWAKEWEEFTKAGGQTGFRDMFRTSKDRAEAIEREIKRVTEGRATQFGRAVFDWLSDYNLAMENAIRLAAFRAGKDAGMSVERAASMAKNLTVNFNRKGTAGTQAGALYAFFNASVQGTARLAETLAGPAGKKIIAGGLTLGVVQALALAAAGFDEDEPPDFVRERNLILPIGGGKYVTIPMPLGLHILPNLARIPTEYALGGFRDGGKKVAELVSVFAEAFNPMGNAGLSLQTLAPTVIDPVAALAENKDWTGKPIAREDFNKMAPTPGFTRARDTASWPSRAVSRALNWMTGGTDYKPGAFSPTPDQIDYLIGQLTGGLGREAQKVEQTATSAISGDELPAYKIPLFGRFYGTTQGQAPQASRFYENLRAINEHEAEIKGRRKAGEPVGEYLRENPEAGLWQLANRVERQVSELRRRRRELLEKDAGKDAVHAIDARLTAIMKSFNDRVRMLREKAAA